MRACDIQSHLQARTDLLCAGQFEELAKLDQSRFVEYQDGFPSFIQNHSKAVKAYSKMGSLLAAQGVIRLEPEVTSVEVAKNNCFKVLSRYSVIKGCGRAISHADVYHYFKQTPEGPRISILEYNSCP